MLKKFMCVMLVCIMMLFSACNPQSIESSKDVAEETTQDVSTETTFTTQEDVYGEDGSGTEITEENTNGQPSETTLLQTTTTTTGVPETPNTTEPQSGGNSPTKAPVSTQTTKPSATGSIVALLNNAPLNPMKTNTPSLDAMIEELFASIHTPDMTTYEKVKACYDYLVDNCSYGQLFGGGEKLFYESNYDSAIVIQAHGILTHKTGVCDHYSSAFTAMCRRIGLEAYITQGTVSKKGGGRAGHTWSYILLDGAPYIFDPQVQDNNPEAPYFFFGKTYQEMGTRYRQYADDAPEEFFKQFRVEHQIYFYDPPETVLVGKTKVVSTRGIPLNVPITWTSDAPQNVTVDNNGTITGKGIGSATITATAVVNNETIRNSFVVSSSKGVLEFSIGDERTLHLGNTGTFTPQISFDEEARDEISSYTIQYSSDNTSVIRFSGINGDYMDAKGIGTATVTAKLICNGDVKAQATCRVTVVRGEEELLGISLPENISLSAGETVSFPMAIRYNEVLYPLGFSESRIRITLDSTEIACIKKIKDEASYGGLRIMTLNKSVNIQALSEGTTTLTVTLIYKDEEVATAAAEVVVNPS